MEYHSDNHVRDNKRHILKDCYHGRRLDARCCLHTTTPREPLCRLLPQVRQNLGVHAEPTTCLNRPTGEGANW